MSYIAGFEDDVFISYAHIDNQPLTEGQKGWISDLHRALEVRLSQLLGEEPSVWRDPKLQGNDYLSDALLSRLPRIATLVSVLSPRYLHSEWCLKELREFISAADRSGGLSLQNRCRVFKVVKTPVPRQQHPPELRDVRGYEFYRIDESTSRPREFFPDAMDEARQHYFAKLEDLAYDLHEMLKSLKASRDGAAALTGHPHGGAVYLAETTSELETSRDAIRRELGQRGLRVLPERPLPQRIEELEAAVRADLGVSRLSIHILGGDYGIVPEGTERSLVSIQNELAAEAARRRPLLRVLWQPPGLRAREERQERFLARLREETAGEPGVDFLESGLEELKSVIRDRLAQNRARPEPRDTAQGPLHLYLICDARDVERLRPLEDYLYERGYEVVRSLLDGEEAAVREDHKENLLVCDAVLIYYGAANESWLRAKLRDLDKAFGYGRTEPMVAMGVFVADPETTHKKSFRTREALVMTGFGDFRPEALAPFLAQLEAS